MLPLIMFGVFLVMWCHLAAEGEELVPVLPVSYSIFALWCFCAIAWIIYQVWAPSNWRWVYRSDKDLPGHAFLYVLVVLAIIYVVRKMD